MQQDRSHRGLATREPGRSRSGLRTAATVAATAVAVLLVLPATAGAYLYWSNSGTSSIGRANLDGSGISSTFITGANTPAGVALDSGHVYWGNNTGFSVGRADLDGTDVNQSLFAVVTGNFVRGVAVDADHIYVALANALGRADIGGSNVNETFVGGASTPIGVAVNDEHIYWRNSASIGRADIDGNNVNQSFIAAASGPRFVALDDDHVYWTNQTTGTIGRADLDGTNVDQSFISGASAPQGIAVDSGHVYWANDTTDTIGRANLDGTGVNQSFISGVSIGLLSGLAVDALTPPATEINSVDLDSTRRRARIGFGSSQPDSTFSCKLDRRDYKSCDAPRVYKRLDRGRHIVRIVARNAQNADDPTPAKVRFRF